MELEALKAALDRTEAHGREHSGSHLLLSEKGPLGIGVGRAVLAALEAQQKRIEELEQKVRGLEQR